MNLGAHLRNPNSDPIHASNVLFYAKFHDYATALHCAGLLSDHDRATRAKAYVMDQLNKEWANMAPQATQEEQATVEAALQRSDDPAIGQIQDVLRQIRQRHERLDAALKAKKRAPRGKAA